VIRQIEVIGINGLVLLNEFLHEVSISGLLVCGLLHDLQVGVFEVGNWRDIVVGVDNHFLGASHDMVGFEQGAVEHSGFILASFAAHIEVELILQRVEVVPEVSDSLAQVSLVQAHAADLHQLSFHLCFNHLVQQGGLLLKPKICQTEKAEASATVLNAQSLVVAKDGT